MQYHLSKINPDDVDFLNSTEIPYHFPDEDTDSGWCDAHTGARVLSPYDCITFDINDESDETTLLLKFGDRITKMP